MQSASPRRPDRNDLPKASHAGSNPAEGTRAAIYARISQSDPNVEAIADQERRCRDLADREGYAVVALFADDGISAYADKVRPGWLALGNALSRREFDVVLGVAEDRFTRDAAVKLGFQAACVKAGVTWHTVGGGKVDPSTASGAMLANVTGALAQYESAVKQERVRASVERRLRDGIDLNGPRPFGFEADRTTIRETEATWVRWAIQAVLDGSTLYAIRKQLNDVGVTTSTGRPWLTTTVRQLLLRPRNAGLLAHKGVIVGDTLPSLVPRENWEAMHAILEHPDRKPKRGPKVAHVGSGVVVCSVCGSAMRFHAPKQGRAPRYICTREKLAVRDRLRHPTMLETDLERVLAESVFMSLTRVEHTDAPADEAAPLRVKRAELARRRKVQQDLAELPGADLEATAKRLAELGRDIADLDTSVAEVVAADSRATLLEVAREAIVELEFGALAVMGKTVFPRWLPKWEGLAIDKQQAIIRDLLGVVVLSFKDVHLTKPDQKVKRERWTPESWKLDPTQAF